VLLTQHNGVVVVDIIEERVNLINSKQSTVADNGIEDFSIKGSPIRDPQSRTCELIWYFTEP